MGGEVWIPPLLDLLGWCGSPRLLVWFLGRAVNRATVRFSLSYSMVSNRAMAWLHW